MRRAGALATAALLLLFANADAGAQTPSHADEIQRLRTSLDMLVPRVEQIKRQDSLYVDSVRRSRAARQRTVMDSMQIGPFRVVGTRHDIAQASDAFESAWQTVAPLFAGVESQYAGVTFVIVRDGGGSLTRDRATRPQHFSLNPRSEDMVDPSYMKRVLGSQITLRLPARVQTWLAGATAFESSDPLWTYRMLVVPMRRDSAHERILKESGRALRYDPTVVPELQRLCAEHDVEACKRVLGITGAEGASVAGVVRSSFLTSVLRNAPAGVLVRPLSGANLVSDLEALGGKPLDALVRTWLDGLDAARRAESRAHARANLSTLFWVLVFAGIAMRSTRWRLG